MYGHIELWLVPSKAVSGGRRYKEAMGFSSSNMVLTNRNCPQDTAVLYRNLSSHWRRDWDDCHWGACRCHVNYSRKPWVRGTEWQWSYPVGVIEGASFQTRLATAEECQLWTSKRARSLPATVGRVLPQILLDMRELIYVWWCHGAHSRSVVGPNQHPLKTQWASERPSHVAQFRFLHSPGVTAQDPFMHDFF